MWYDIFGMIFINQSGRFSFIHFAIERNEILIKYYIFFDTCVGNAILGPWRETEKMLDSTIDDESVR